MRGFSLIELMVSVGIGGIVSLAIAALFSTAVEQFNFVVEQNHVEENLLLSSYYLRAFMANAVKLRCTSNAIITAAWNFANDDCGPTPGCTSTWPENIPIGVLDCNHPDNAAAGGSWGHYSYFDATNPFPPAGVIVTPGDITPIGEFIRENGSGGVGGTSAASDYQATGIYFKTPDNAGNSGVLYFSQAKGGAPLNFDNSTIWFDDLVDIGMVPNSEQYVSYCDPLAPVASPCSVGFTTKRLESISYHIIARYFKSYASTMGGLRNYQRTANQPGGSRDIEMTVTIGFRDNINMTSQTGTQSSERLHGGVYYYRFIAPPMSTLGF